MAEMTAAEALGILGGSERQPQSEQELITSIIAGMTRGEKCFVLLWDSERVQLAALIQQQAATIEALEKTIVKRCQYHRKNDAHRCPYNSKGCMDWELCNKHFHDCGKEWQVKEGQNDV